MPRYRDKVTGEIIYVPDAPQAIPIGMQDPTRDLKRPQAEASINSANTSAARTNQQIGQDAAMFPAQKQLADLQAQLAALKVQEAQKELNAKSPFNGEQLQSVKDGAWRNLQRIGRINENYREGWAPTIGFGSGAMRSIGGTRANDVATDLGGLQKSNALTEIMKMTQATGKNPFTPMSNTDVDTIAQSLGSASLDQSPDGFFKNLDDYKQAAIKAYAGSSGLQRLNEEMDRRNLSPADRERALRMYNADPRVKNIGARQPPMRPPRKSDDSDIDAILRKHGVRK